MTLLIEIPAAMIWLIVIVAVVFAILMYCVVNAEERDEDAVLHNDMDGYVRDVEPSADQELKK